MRSFFVIFVSSAAIETSFSSKFLRVALLPPIVVVLLPHPAGGLLTVGCSVSLDFASTWRISGNGESVTAESINFFTSLEGMDDDV